MFSMNYILLFFCIINDIILHLYLKKYIKYVEQKMSMIEICHFYFSHNFCMSTSIHETYSQLRDIVKKNPQNLWIYEKLNTLTQLVHAQIIENIKGVYWDWWEKSTTYASFQNNVNERAQMERNVLKKEIGVSISIVEINQQISMAMMTAMTEAPNIFSTDIDKVDNNVKHPVDAPKITKEPLNKVAKEEVHEESQESNWDLLKKNKEVILRLVRDKKSKWFALRKASDFTTFFVVLEWNRISYNQIAELFLWKGALNTHDNMLRVHTRLSEQLFDEESMERRYNTFKEAIKAKWDWLELKDSVELRNDYSVIIWNEPYRYRALIAIFWVNKKSAKLLSQEVYEELSIALFWKSWKSDLEAIKMVNERKEQARRTYHVPEINFEDENALRELYEKQEPVKSEKLIREELLVKEKIEVKEEDEEMTVEEVSLASLRKELYPQTDKETEYNNNRRMVVALALQAMDQNPELKKLWFGPYSERGQRLFNFEYEWEHLTLRRIAELTGLYWINKRIPFPKFIEQIFWIHFVNIMREELEEEEKEKKAFERARKDADELLKNQSDSTVDTEIKQEGWIKVVDKPVEPSEEILMEQKKEAEKEERIKILTKKLEDAWILDSDKNWLNQSMVLVAFDNIVEECIKLDKEATVKKINQLINREWCSIIKQCKKKYPKADSSLKNLCKNEKFIWECKTEFLLIKQDEVRTKITKYFSDWNISQIKNFYWGLVRGLENIDFAQECYDYIIDTVEDKYRESHQEDEKWTLDELKAQEAAYQNDLREKGIETYCKNNNITREQYTALRYLVRNLKRKKVGQDMERYLYKLKSRNESLRGEEFENDFSDEMINALKTFWIKLAMKDNSKKNKKKA